MSFTTPEKAKLYLRSYLQGAEMYNALKAMEICLQYHTGTRKDKTTPEWFHQVSIVLYLTTLEKVIGPLNIEDVCVVGFLHDVVEDCDYPLSAIESLFGKRIARSVSIISKKTPGIMKKTNEDYYNQIGEDCVASIVKGADRIHNFQSMPGVFNNEKQEQYIADARDNIIPMLKKARNRFPKMRPVYENLKHVLTMQMMLIDNTLKALK